MDNKRVIFLVVAIFLGLVAIVPIFKFIGTLQKKLADSEKMRMYVPVLVATKDIPRESTLTETMVRVSRVHRDAFQRGDLYDPVSAVGKFAEVDILEGQHINTNMVRSIGSFRFLSQKVPKGMRAITIPVDRISALEALIKPGDHVDVIGTFSIPQDQGQGVQAVLNIFQGIQILATNRNISNVKASKDAGTVTLALKPEDVKVLTYVLEWGKIRLVLRRPLDTTVETGYSAVTFDTLMRRLGFWRPLPPPKRSQAVEVYKGTEKEESVLYP